MVLEEKLNALKNRKIVFHDSTDSKDVFNIDSVTPDEVNGYWLKYSNEQLQGGKSLTKEQLTQLSEGGKTKEMCLLDFNSNDSEMEECFNEYLGQLAKVEWKGYPDDHYQTTVGIITQCKYGLLTIASTYRPPTEELEKCGIRNVIIPLRGIREADHLEFAKVIIAFEA